MRADEQKVNDLLGAGAKDILDYAAQCGEAAHVIVLFTHNGGTALQTTHYGTMKISDICVAMNKFIQRTVKEQKHAQKRHPRRSH